MMKMITTIHLKKNTIIKIALQIFLVSKNNLYKIITREYHFAVLPFFCPDMHFLYHISKIFLGVKKPVVKAHGSSDALLFEYTIIQAEKFVENKAVDKMKEAFENQRSKEN